MSLEPHDDQPLRGRERFLYGGVFLVSTAVLLLQIALTRIFSFSLWYHFAYVTISVALLGYGASGTFLAVFPQLAGRDPAHRMSLYALACGLSIVLAYTVFATLPFWPFQLLAQPGRQIPYMLVYYAAVVTPFFLAGLCISVALKTLAQQVSRLYFFDLAGAGAGCLLVVLVISAFTTPGAVSVAAVIVCLAGAMFSRATQRGGLALAAAVTGVAAVLGTVLAANLDFGPSPEKFLHGYTTLPEYIKFHRHHWSAIFRTDVIAFTDEQKWRALGYNVWGVSPYWKNNAIARAPKRRTLTHDGDAGADIYNFDGDLSKLELFENLILKAPYLLLDKPNVLVIGVGGGADIVNAIKNHARHVTGVELDPYTINLVKVDEADFAGHIYDRPDVTMIAGEGRSTLRRSQARYDLIEITGVDTLAALSTGAYVLSESYLYTAEAIGDFLDHLTPNGVLSVVVGDFNGRVSFPRMSVRELSLYVEALQQRGIDDPQSRIAVLASAEGVPLVALLLKNSPLTRADSNRIQDFADRMGFQVWALPGRSFDTENSRYLRATASQRAAFLAQLPLNMYPTSDDDPFFFNFYQWRNLGKDLHEIDTRHTLATGQIVLGVILLVAIVSSILLILLPLFIFERRGLRTEGKWGFIAFFLGIGLGFIFIEISFIQKFVLFLGYPTYSLTVVLFSLLTYSGVGSLMTSRMRRPPEQRLLPLFAGLSVLSVAYMLVLTPLFQAFLGSPFPLRVFIASAVLMPLGLIMGMFFPSGIHIVRRGNVNFVPWAWGINGCASVVATVLAVMLAMSYGFRVVTLLALASYLVGVLGMRASAAKVTA